MKLTVKFFARYREITGNDEVEIDVEDGSTVAGLIARLAEEYPGFPADPHMVAVNAEYIEGDAALNLGDEVAFFPPFSGG